MTTLTSGGALAAPATLTDAGTVSTGETILFCVVSLVTVVCALGVLTARRAVSAAVNMIGIMIGLAVLYLANEASFLGMTQVVVYTGAVMTLVLFVIMLVGVGGEEPVTGSRGVPAPVALLAGGGLVAVLAAVVCATVFPGAAGLLDGEAATPAALAEVLLGNYVVTMELTGILLVVAALGALTLTHRQRLRGVRTQREQAEERMRAYATKGVHPGQRPAPGVYAATNSAAAPALDASGQAVEVSVPRPLVVRGQDLDVSQVSPGTGTQVDGALAARDQAVPRSGMPAMPGAAAPVVVQPLLPGAGTQPGADAPAPAPKEEPT